MINLHQNQTNERDSSTETALQIAARESGEIVSNLHFLTAEIADWKSASGGTFAEILAGWAIPQYVIEARNELGKLATGGDRLKLLQHLVRDSVAIQRGGYWTPRLQIDRERLALEHEKHKLARELASQEPRKRRDVTQPLTDEERLAIIDKVDEVMGLKQCP